MWNPDLFQAAWRFAASAHNGQLVPGTNLPYLTHIGWVVAEVMACPEADDLAIACAVLHDTLEDTKTTFEQLREAFGPAVADGVQALTKIDTMADSLRRIRLQPPQVWMVKLADRITNLQPAPAHWKPAKREAYREEAERILQELGAAHAELAERLRKKIAAYS